MNSMEDLRTNYCTNRHMYQGMQRLDMCPWYIEHTDVPSTEVHRLMAGMSVFSGVNKDSNMWVEMIERYWKGTIL